MQRGTYYIFFLLFFSFTKKTTHKNDYYFVLLYEIIKSSIYYIKNQINTHCTKFVQNRTFRTNLHKILFCTQWTAIELKSTVFVLI